MKLDKVAYTAFIKACGTSPGLVDAAHAAFKKMVWGPRRMKPNQVTFVTTMRVLREASRLHQALDVYLGMRRAGTSHHHSWVLYSPAITCICALPTDKIVLLLVFYLELLLVAAALSTVEGMMYQGIGLTALVAMPKPAGVHGAATQRRSLCSRFMCDAAEAADVYALTGSGTTDWFRTLLCLVLLT